VCLREKGNYTFKHEDHVRSRRTLLIALCTRDSLLETGHLLYKWRNESINFHRLLSISDFIKRICARLSIVHVTYTVTKCVHMRFRNLTFIRGRYTLFNYSSYIRLWLVNFLLLEPHPLLLLLIVDHGWILGPISPTSVRLTNG